MFKHSIHVLIANLIIPISTTIAGLPLSAYLNVSLEKNQATHLCLNEYTTASSRYDGQVLDQPITGYKKQLVDSDLFTINDKPRSIVLNLHGRNKKVHIQPGKFGSKNMKAIRVSVEGEDRDLLFIDTDKKEVLFHKAYNNCKELRDMHNANIELPYRNINPYREILINADFIQPAHSFVGNDNKTKNAYVMHVQEQTLTLTNNCYQNTFNALLFSSIVEGNKETLDVKFSSESDLAYYPLQPKIRQQLNEVASTYVSELWKVQKAHLSLRMIMDYVILGTERSFSKYPDLPKHMKRVEKTLTNENIKGLQGIALDFIHKKISTEQYRTQVEDYLLSSTEWYNMLPEDEGFLQLREEIRAVNLIQEMAKNKTIDIRKNGGGVSTVCVAEMEQESMLTSFWNSL